MSTTEPTSRIPGFHALSLEARLEKIASLFGLSREEKLALRGDASLDAATAGTLIENAVGTYRLPLGLALNLTVNGRDRIIPMAVEEPSVIAAVSLAGKIARGAGGFQAEADPSVMIAQVQVTRYGDVEAAMGRIAAAKEDLLALANGVHPQLVRRGGGARDVEVRVLPAPEGPSGEPLLIVHLLIDTCEAMG
ncbi:MAG TPA: 3-hydroxy-3-methylglutaryl-CoA reductase, partial [Myxococcales bacterium]|nr:3-hydroxy-3-methylglutaryl-CoA reductase [Myxococcales bacterium]